MKKLKKLELIEAPISEMDQEMMENILAGWLCTSYSPTGTCLTYGCSSFEDVTECSRNGATGNYCKLYYSPGGNYCEAYVTKTT